MIYLNSGSVSRTPRVVVEAIHSEIEKYELNPTEALFNTWGRVWSVQKQVAQFFGANPNDLFLRNNITEALNDQILGAALGKGSSNNPHTRGEILINPLEYGAIVNLCRMRADRDNLSIRSIDLPIHSEVTEEEILDAFQKAIRPETQMILVSHISTSTGVVFPIFKLGQLARKHGAILVVDGAHAPGAIPLNFSDFDSIDYYAGNLHKWMQGPKGTAFGWVHPKHQDSFTVTHGGWTTYETPAVFQGFPSRFAAKMLNAASNHFASQFAIEVLLEHWNERNPKTIFSLLQERQNLVRTEMPKHFTLLSPSGAHPELCGPLITFEVPEPYKKMGFHLMKAIYAATEVQVATPEILGRTVLRISPHIDVSLDEISLGLKKIVNYLGG